MIGRAAVAAAAALALLAGPASAARRASRRSRTTPGCSTAPQPSGAPTLDEMKALGADRVRVTVIWRRARPGSDERARPGLRRLRSGAYPAMWAFADYDAGRRATRHARGLGVNFDVTGPAPLWATRSAAASTDVIARPPTSRRPRSYGAASSTAGSGASATRGDVRPALPRVAYWSLWNEPNQSGWLTPHWPRGAFERAPVALPRAGRRRLVARWPTPATGATPILSRRHRAEGPATRAASSAS